MRKNRASSVAMRIFVKREGYFSRAVSLDEISSCGLCRYAILDAFQFYPQYAWSCAFFRNILAFLYFARIFLSNLGIFAVIFTIAFVRISANTIQIWVSICCKILGGYLHNNVKEYLRTIFGLYLRGKSRILHFARWRWRWQ